MAADPVQVASNVYTTLFENERVRLLEARLTPGDSSAMHGHPDHVVYNLVDALHQITFGNHSRKQ